MPRSPLHRRGALRLLAWALGTLLAFPAVPRAALMIANPPYRPKDFTMVKKDGVYHLFYIRHDITVPMEQTEFDLGHAVSTDLFSWTQLPPVLHARDGAWDNHQVWAPSIVERDGVYYMFYTGVSDSAAVPWTGWQRTGIATSTDLMTWNRLDAPIYSCLQVPWCWCDSTNQNTGFRDPFVMPDPNVPGRWLMYSVTFPSSDTLGMIVGVAASDGDFTRWTDLKPLWITQRAYSWNTIVESPHLFPHNGLWYLFFTTNAGQPISYAIGSDPIGDPPTWSYKGRLANMLGVDTQTWIASEHFQDGTREYFMFVNYNRIEIYQMVWNPNGTFVLYEPSAFHVTGMDWVPTSATAGDSVALRIAAVGWSGQSASLEAVEVLGDGSQVPVSMDSLGLPSTVPLTGDTTAVPWVASIRHASGDTTGAMSLVVRMTDLTAQTPTLGIEPPPYQLRGLAWSPDSVAAWSPETLTVSAQSGAGHTVRLEGLEVLPSDTVAVSLASLGLPDSLTLPGDLLRLRWLARIRHASGDTTGTMNLLLRTRDRSVAAPLVTVLPPVTTSPPSDPPDPDNRRPGTRWSLRVLRGSPAGGRAALLVTLPSPMATRLDLYDLQGRRIRTLADRVLPTGATVLAWDGRDTAGGMAPRGIYFLRAHTPLGTRTARLLLLP